MQIISSTGSSQVEITLEEDLQRSGGVGGRGGGGGGEWFRKSRRRWQRWTR